jgi:hypothetical protein
MNLLEVILDTLLIWHISFQIMELESVSALKGFLCQRNFNNLPITNKTGMVMRKEYKVDANNLKMKAKLFNKLWS